MLVRRECATDFQRLVERSSDVVFRYELTEPRGFSYINGAAERVLGYTPEEFYADPDLFLELLHPEDRALLRQHLAGQVRTGEHELRWRHRDGHVVWTEEQIVRDYDCDGRVVAIEGIARDITARKQLEAALADREIAFRDLFETAPVCYHELDAEGRIIRVNQTELFLLGYREEEVLGRFEWELHSDPEDARLGYEAWLAAGAPATSIECAFRRRDGTCIDVTFQGQVLADARGTRLGVRMIMLDTSEQVRRRKRHLALLRVARQLAAVSESREALQVALDEAVALLEADSGAVLRWDEEREVLIPLFDSLPSVTKLAPQQLGLGASGQAAQRREPVIVNDYQHSSSADQGAIRAGVCAAVAAPLLHLGRLLGVLTVFSERPGRQFGGSEVEVLELLAGSVAAAVVGLERARLDGVLLAARTAQHEINTELGATCGFIELLMGDAALPEHLRELATEAYQGAMQAANRLQQLRQISQLAEKDWGANGPRTLDLPRSIKRPRQGPRIKCDCNEP